MTEVFTVTRRVAFCETDAAGIAHFSSFFLYMESAEHALLRHLGLSVFMEDAQGTLTWPRAAANCDYLGMVRFDEELSIEVAVSRLGDKSVTYQFDFKVGERAVAQGRMTAVCCRIHPDHQIQTISIPDSIRSLLQPYVAEL
jgi:4-hydroxybenzoyl-CoA thioesterase/acyl-CoA thioester hydrolase